MLFINIFLVETFLFAYENNHVQRNRQAVTRVFVGTMSLSTHNLYLATSIFVPTYFIVENGYFLKKEENNFFIQT